MVVRLALLVLVASMGRPVSAWDADKNARLLREIEAREFNGVALVAEGELRVDVPVATPERPSVFAATYGDDEVVSTVDDLFAFGRALKDGELLRPSTLARALTPSRLVSGEDGPYGLGFRMQDAADGSTIVYHTGSTNGFLAVCTYPTEDNDVTVVLLTNVIDGGFAELREAVFDIVWSPS